MSMMGLSSKQVSGEGLDWGQALLQAGTLELPKNPPIRRQQQQQQSEPLKCPRCDSTNTKFCYYNNYNKSQPRHFCKSCKRHWTKGGTLRNVPIGGGRKNKRLKTSSTAVTAAATTTAAAAAAATSATNTNISHSTNTHMAIQAQQQRQCLPLSLGDQKSVCQILCESLIRPPSSLQHDFINGNSSFSGKNFGSNNGIFQGSLLSVRQNQNLHIPFPSLSSFDSNPSPISSSFQSSSVYNYTGEPETVEDSTISSMMPTTSQPWQAPTSGNLVDMSFWGLDDIDVLASADLNLSWDDSEIKP